VSPKKKEQVVSLTFNQQSKFAAPSSAPCPPLSSKFAARVDYHGDERQMEDGKGRKKSQ
jgi:hypothetical protein